MEPRNKAPHLLCAGRVIHSHKHTIELVKYSRKHVHLENKARASSILTLSWRIPDEPPRWKVAAEPQKTPGFLVSGEELNLGPVRRLDLSGLLCSKVSLKYKRDRESFWHRAQKGAERVPGVSSSFMHSCSYLIGTYMLFNRWKDKL